jgi:hypothetical protein
MTGEQRRLKTILNDERYGPALVRLNRKDQRVILDLISANRGREARTEILARDETRRARGSTRRRTLARVRQYRVKSKAERSGDARLAEIAYIDEAELDAVLFWANISGEVA